ncbi:MAG: hypothetical protein IV100_17705 [Myxococcales bacterium]|nr:hypothetical protein [Myxococcales bacterium]
MSQPEKAVVRPRLPLTDRQREFLHHVESLWTDDGPPTVRQLCEAAGFISTNAVADHLRQLEKKGWANLRSPRHGGQRAVGRSGIVRLLHATTWPWWEIMLHGKSASYRISIQAPTFSLAAVWAREDWHQIGAPDTLDGVEISLSPRTEPEFEGWEECAHAE